MCAMGGAFYEDGSVVLPQACMVQELDSNIGLLTIEANGCCAKYSLSSLEREESRYEGLEDAAFARDLRAAIGLVRTGTHHAIVICAIAEDDAHTQLVVFARDIKDSLRKTVLRPRPA